MRDSRDRKVGYLRLSLTPACHMRCLYCRPDWHTNHAEGSLDPAEIQAIASHLVAEHGIRKIRLTGGDPTARPDLLEIIERLARLPGIEDLAMTTNGVTLAAHARAYADAGLDRINISLDTLDPELFARMTGLDTLERVLAGIDAAVDAQLTPVKLNTVVIKGMNDRLLAELVRFAGRLGLEIRFIELMPMGPLADRWAERYVPADAMRAALAGAVVAWQPLEQGASAAAPMRATLDDGSQVRVGFITPMSCNFCDACDRVRIASDGSLYPCLMDQPAGSILPAVRPRFDPQAFDAILAAGLDRKAAEHPARGFVTMTVIGG